LPREQASSPFKQVRGATAVRELFRALIFVCFAWGFRPLSARELDDSTKTRIQRLYRLIDSGRYGIHDLSRTELDDGNKLPRFDMPLELGLLLGAKRWAGKRSSSISNFSATQPRW